MNKFIYYPIFIMFLIGIFTQLLYASEIDMSYSGTQEQPLTGNQTLDESESELEIEERSLSLDFGMTVGLVVIIVSAIVLGLIGINILGSGLSDYSIKIMWNGIVFYGLWLIFSVIGFNFFSIIPILGVGIWIALTLVYTMGVLGRMGN